MKPSKIIPLLLLASIIPGGKAGWKVVGQQRKLADGDDGIMVQSLIEGAFWCFTVSDGADNSVLLQPCEMFATPASQLWHFEGGMFKSDTDPSRCLRVYRGIFLTGSSRARLEDCSVNTNLNIFDHDDGGTQWITLRDHDSFCLTNQGSAREGAPIVARECALTERFLYYMREPNNFSGIVGLCNDDAYPDGGCLVVAGENPQPGTALILGSHNLDHGWRIDEDGLFHTALDDNMCMQAGSEGPAVSGTPMRLYPCDSSNPKQIFVYDRVDIELKGSAGLCVGFQGSTSQVDKDPLILKACDKIGNNWSEDF